MKPSAIVHEEHFHIAASHPALDGHFPGNPIVPGVVVLEHVAAAAERAWGVHVTGLPHVKFPNPLKPDEQVNMRIQRGADGMRFDIMRGAVVIASGVAEVAA